MKTNEHTMPRTAAGVVRSETVLQVGSSIIPTLGMTFAEAVAKVLVLIDEQDATEDGEDLFFEWDPIREAVLAATPESIADAVAVLDLLLCRNGLPADMVPEPEIKALTKLRELLASMVDAQHQAKPANDQTSQLMAMTSAFEAEASTMIQIPAEPSEGMLDAAASKAGISLDQAQAFYRSVIDAFDARAA